jgi:hypothetical protein
MTAETRKKIQLALLAAFVLATARAGYIFYQRHQDQLALERKKKAEAIGYFNPDYYVNPKKLYPYDLKSAKELTQQPVWVKEGYRYTYFKYQSGSKHVDFAHDAGLLGPIEKLAITDVVLASNPVPGQPKQVVALFQKEGKPYAVPIGYLSSNGDYKIYSDEMFYIQDPRDLYKHWPGDVWQAVEQHEVKPGMNEMQTDFAIGMGVPDAGDTSYEKIVRYPNGGKPVVIVYHDGKAAEIKPGTPPS